MSQLPATCSSCGATSLVDNVRADGRTAIVDVGGASALHVTSPGAVVMEDFTSTGTFVFGTPPPGFDLEAVTGPGAVTVRCPRCSAFTAELVPGIYELTAEVTKLLLTSARTGAGVLDLRERIQSAERAGLATPEEVIDHIGADPVVRRSLRQWWAGLSTTNKITLGLGVPMGLVTTLGVAIAAAQFTLNLHIATGERVTEEEVHQIVEDHWRDQLSRPAAPQPPPPAAATTPPATTTPPPPQGSPDLPPQAEQQPPAPPRTGQQ